MKTRCKNCFIAVSDSSRMNIVEFLKKNTVDVTVNDVVAKLALRQPTVTFHINKLVSAGIVRKKKSGRQVFLKLYHLSRECSDCPVFN